MQRFTAIRDEIDTLVREGRRTLFSTRRKSTFQKYMDSANENIDEAAFHLNIIREWIIRQESAAALFNKSKRSNSQSSTHNDKDSESTPNQYFSGNSDVPEATNGENNSRQEEIRARDTLDLDEGGEGEPEDNGETSQEHHLSWASQRDAESLIDADERLRTDSPTREKSIRAYTTILRHATNQMALAARETQTSTSRNWKIC